MKKAYSVKNKADDVRQFWDRYKGANILVEPGKSVMTFSPPEKSEIFEVKEKKEEPKKEEKNKEAD